jgi:hypothetical protein
MVMYCVGLGNVVQGIEYLCGQLGYEGRKNCCQLAEYLATRRPTACRTCGPGPTWTPMPSATSTGGALEVVLTFRSGCAYCCFGRAKVNCNTLIRT